MRFPTVAAAVALALVPAGSALAADTAISVTQPWLRATPKGAAVAGGYATIRNSGSQPDTLVGARLPTARDGQIHTMTMKNGVMEMRRLDAGLPIAPGATVTLKPGGNHLMFVGLGSALKEGETVRGSLVFAKAGAVPVTFAVGAIGARTAPGEAAPSGQAGAGMPGMTMPDAGR